MRWNETLPAPSISQPAKDRGGRFALAATMTTTTDHVAIHPRIPSTPPKHVLDTSSTPSAKDQPFSKRPSTSDGETLNRPSPLTRPKFRRRGHSATSPRSSGPGDQTQPQTPDSRPKTSPTTTSPNHLPPALSFKTISISSHVQPSLLSPEIRSPFSRRPPASRSCHGIETSTGPPPAISTQRAYSYSSEHPWKYPANKENYPAAFPKLTPHALAELDAANRQTKSEGANTTQQDQEHKKEAEADVVRSIESPEAGGEGMVTVLAQPQPEPAMDRERKRYSVDLSKRVSQRLSSHLADARPAMRSNDSEKSSQEDLFLNMAQDEGGDDETIHGNQEQRRVSRRYILVAPRSTCRSNV